MSHGSRRAEYCPRWLRVLLLFLSWQLLVSHGWGQPEPEALAISRTIQQRHLPYGTILDPVFATPASDQIVAYARAGDSALWTGHYVAAEAFRSKVTGSEDALTNLRQALAGIRALVDVTGTNLLARCLVPVDSPFAAALLQDGRSHAVFTHTLQDQSYYWIGSTSRDQYAGVFFGLSVAYDLIKDPQVRTAIDDVVTRLLDFLLHHNWAVVMPDGATSTSFWGHPDQQLSLLQVGRRVNPGRFDAIYNRYRALYAPAVLVPIAVDVRDEDTDYFKFNLDTIILYTLIRFEDSAYHRWWYTQAYTSLWRTTDGHSNAHFNMIDRGLQGPDGRRDAETRELLAAWLTRSRRDDWVDWRGVYPACGRPDRACAPLRVVDRGGTDFLWQRSPFGLVGGGEGTIEGAGIDYILPYWMARYYGVL
jgi:hypothetical protein